MSVIPEWVSKGSKVILDHANKECDEKRKFMIPRWKQAEYYWNDIQDLFYNADKSDWSTFDEDEGQDVLDALRDNNKIINTYRAEGESIIAAATIGNLSIRFFPENADDPLDLDKARSFSDKSDYVQRVNNIKELRRKAFTIRWNQGLVASYTYFKKDKKRFGSLNKDIIGIKKLAYLDKTCTQCGEVLPSEPIEDVEGLAAEMMAKQQAQGLDPNTPIDPNAPPPEISEPEEVCPVCGNPELEETIRTEDIPYKIGEEKRDRGCATIELYSPLSFKVPHYATKASDINYVILEGEIHYATARSLYPDFADKIHPNNIDSEEAIHRTQADNYSAIASNSLVTIQRFWCKPDMYNVLGEGNSEYDAAKFLKKYPDGKFATFINGDLMVECKNEDMDEHWTFVESPMGSHVYIRSLGNARIPIQDMENDLVYLTMDTIRHSIGETYYDSRVIDRRAFKERMTKPGDMTPVNNKVGASRISDLFYSTKSASLSREVDAFLQHLGTKGQFISGALPSLFGGMFEEGSKTLGVYEQSRQQALQRVAIPANGIDDFLAITIHKATELYDKNMESDEIYSVEAGNSYNNVTLRKSAPNAKIARVEVVKSEQFPTTWEQKRAFVMEMLEKNLEPINAAIFAVDNLGSLAQLIGIPEMKIPGVADRNKQLHEINELLKSEPQMDPSIQMIDPAMIESGQAPSPIIPTIMPDPQVDNHNVHIQTIISWAVSPEGIREKINNPEGYANVIMHLIEHQKIATAMMATSEEEQEVEKNEGEQE